MKLWLRICSMFLTTVMVFNLLPHQTIASSLKTAETSGGTDVVTSAMEEVKDVEPASIMAEIAENRTEFSKEFRLSNGQHMAVVYPEAVHYEKDGQWKDIDNTLTATGTRSNGTFRNAQGNWQVAFPQQLRGDNRVSVTEKGYTISFGMAGELRAIVAEKAEVESSTVMRQNTLDQTVLTVTQMQASVAQIAEKNTALGTESTGFPELVPNKLTSRLIYNNIYANTDIAYDLSSGRLKESVVLNSYNSAVRGYRYILETGKLIPVLNEDNSIDLIVPDSKEIIMSMPAPYMIDNAGVTNTKVGVSLVASGESYILTYTMPIAWLAEAERAWPVILDPMITASSNCLNILDQFVAQYYQEPYDHGTTYTGYYGPFGKMRAFLQYVELPTMTSADVIVNATLTLRRHGGTSGTTVVEAHKVNAAWNSTTITWANQPGYNETVEDYSLVGGNNRYYWEITDVVRSWYAGQNYGVMLKSPNSVETGGTADWKKFYTVDYDVTDSSTWPILSITFRNNNGLEEYWDYTTSTAGRAGTGYVNNYSGNLTWVHNDLGFDGNRMPVSISHVYNANDSAENRFGLGYGWRTNFNQTVQLWTTDTRYYVWEDGDGTKHYFLYDSESNTYKDEDGLELTLTVVGDDKVITDKNGNTSHFDSSGRLWKLENNQQTKSSIQIFYQGTSNNLISRIEDGIGRKYIFCYDDNLLTDINYVGKGNTTLAYIEFTYEDSLLAEIIYDDSKVGTFKYGQDEDNPSDDNFLTAVIDIDGYRLEYTYSSTTPKRVVGIREMDETVNGGSMSIEYAHNQTTFTDHNNQVKILQFNDWGNTTCIQDSEGRAQYAQYAINDYIERGKANQMTLSSKLQNTVNNQLMSSGFEDGNLWFNNSSIMSMDRSTEAAYAGNYSLKMNITESTGANCVYGEQVTVNPGESIVLSAYVKSTGTTVMLGYHCNDYDGYSFMVYGVQNQPTGEWERIDVSYTNTTSVTLMISQYLFCIGAGTVYMDCVQAEIAPTPSRYNLLQNGDFTANGYWSSLTGRTSLSADEETAAPQLDSYVYQFTGTPTTVNTISQTVPVNGKAGDTLILAGWAKGASVPLNDENRRFGMRLTFLNTDGTTSESYISFNPATGMENKWQFVSMPAVAQKAYSSVTVYLEYNYNANTAYFDGIQLFKEEFGSSYTYDAEGKVISVIDLQKQETQYKYDTNDNLTRIIQNNKAKVAYEYDNYHNVTKVTTIEGLVYEFGYDAYGNNTSVSIDYYGNKITSTAAYTADGNRLEKTTDALAKTTTYCYNENTNVLEWVKYPNDTDNTRTEYTYDMMYRLATATADVDTGYSLTASYIYADDMLTGIQTGSTVYTFTYGDFAQRSSISIGSRNLATYSYTADQNRYLSALTYGNEDYIQYTYDDLGRIILETYEDGSTVSYAYDNNGALATSTDYESGIKTTYYYDLTDRLMKYRETGGLYNHSVGYEYNVHNNLTKLVEIINESKHTTSYTYDEDNRVIGFNTDNENGTILYDNFGRVDAMYNTTHAITKDFSYTYNANQISRVNIGTDQYSRILDYLYDDNGNITSQYDHQAGLTTYTYDSANQLTGEYNSAVGKQWYWTYDDAGNILTRKEYVSGVLTDTVTYGYTDRPWGDLLTSYDGNTITYDAIGNPLTCGTRTFTWKQGRQLATYSNGGPTWHYTYDANGMRVIRTTGSVSYHYIYNGSKLSQMVKGTNTLYFSYDAFGAPWSVNWNGTVYNYFTNLQGDVIAILNSSGYPVVEYTYDAWGKLLAIGGSMATTLGTLNPLTYRGYVYDHETSLYYLQSRYYDPEIGRFINADEFTSTGQGLLGNNTFAYCGNNPVSRRDCSGNAWETVFDILSLTTSLAEVIANPADPWAWAGLVGDVVDVAVPFVTGVGEATRAVKTTVQVVDKVDDVLDAAKAIKKTADAASDINKATGTYVVLYKSGKNYVGKGGFSRAITSATEHMNKYSDEVSSLIWAPTSSVKDAFVSEFFLQSVRGVGRKLDDTYNLIWSPGRKLF